jgi:phenylpropionate dioxygenase-like ring-hydroxylating dioxygenase large terminal subunit
MASRLISVINEETLQKVAEPLQRAWTLPPEAYTDGGIFDAEIEKIFKKDWVCVARQDQVSDPGDFVCFDLPGQPIVIVRDRTGELRALSRICLHRSMPVIEGKGNATRFTCPYHSWTYELDGSLRSAPMMEGVEDFDPKNCKLPSLKTEIWQGFVFVNQDEDAEPLAPKLERFSSLIENYEFEKLEVIETIEFPSPYNWKVLVENFMEAYHHIGTHKNTFQPVYPAKDTFVEYDRNDPWLMLRMPGIHEEDGINVFPKLEGKQLDELFAACVYPTLLFAASASGGFWYQLEPGSEDQMRLRIHALAFPEVAQSMDEESREMLRAGVTMIHEEDIEANEGVWKGLQAGATKQGRLSLFEESIWHLNQLWLDRMN